MKNQPRKKADPFKAEVAAPIVHDRATHQAIAEKAYELYEKGGRRHGRDLEDWLEAEQLILSEKKIETPAQKPLSSVPRSKKGR